MLPRIRQTVGLEYPLLVDGGIKHGGEIALAIALGADFVLVGRAFMFAVAALGRYGASYGMDILKAELKSTLLQLGCRSVRELPLFLKT